MKIYYRSIFHTFYALAYIIKLQDNLYAVWNTIYILVISMFQSALICNKCLPFLIKYIQLFRYLDDLVVICLCTYDMHI